MAGAVRRRGAARPRRTGAPGAAGLLALLLASAALAALLWELEGLPRAPDAERIGEVLSGTELSDQDAAAAAAAAGWLVLLYLALSVGLRLALLAAARLSGGARWARTGLRLSALVTIPAVRRLVDGGVGGALLAASWLPLPAQVEAAGSPAHAAVQPALVAQAEAGPDEAEPAREARRFLLYTVAPGDDLWEIARRVHSDGSRFVEIVEANRGRVMESGERFTGPGLLRPGWVLRVPEPAPAVEAADGVLAYRVRPGDHLWGIAERFLGDGFRWVEIWERNRGREVEAGIRLTDPDRLRPGWVLALPVESAPDGPAGTGSPGTPAAGGRPAPPAPSPHVPPPAEGPGGPPGEWPELPRPLLLTAAGFLVVGGTAVFVRRLRRDGRLRLPGSRHGADDGPGDAVRVTVAARSLSGALADCGFEETRPLLAEESGQGLAFTLSCPAGDAGALHARRHDLERRLDCEVGMEEAGAAAVLLTMDRSFRPPDPLAEQAGPPALVVPVGSDDGGVVYLDLAACGAVTLAGPEGERARLLRSWVATLQSTHAPQQLALRLDAATAAQLGEAWAPPHGGGSAGAAELIPELEELLASRAADGNRLPVLAVVSPGAGDAAALDGLQRDGPRAGLFIVRLAPADEVPEVHGPRDARVVAGAPGRDPEGGETGGGAITLTLGAGRARHLDAVTVRRDTAARWSVGPGGGESGPAAGQPVEAGTGAALPGAPGRAADGPREQLDPDPGAAPDTAWPWEEAVLGATCEGDAPAGRPLPGEPLGDARAPGEPEGAEAPAAGDAGPGDREEEALPAPGGENAARGRPPPGERRTPGHGRDGAGAPAPDPEGRPGAEPAPGPERDAPATGDPLPTGAATAAPGGRGEPGGVGGPARTPGEPAGDRLDPAAGTDGPRFPPAPPAPAASPGGDGHGGSPSARQPTLLTDREMSDLRVEVRPPGPVFQVRCLGPFRLSAKGAPVARWPLEKSRELLAFLAAQGPVSVAREVVAEALWPEYAWDASLKHTLSNVVTTLRGTLRTAAANGELQPLVAVRQRLQLQPGIFSVDLEAFDAAITRARDLPPQEAIEGYERALRLYAGDFLEGEFFTWLDPYRMDYRRRLLDAAREAAGIAEGIGSHPRAAPFHRAILKREPTDEEAVRGLMRCLARSSDIVGARKAFAELSQALEEELGDAGVRPSAETRALLVELAGSAARG